MDNAQVRDIVLDEEQLGIRSEEIDPRKDSKLLKSIVLDLKFTIRDKIAKGETILGMCAPQIGFQKRIVVLNFNGDLRAYVNPMITKAEGLSFNKETIPNIPGKNYLVPRYNNIEVSYQTATGKLGFNNFVGVASHIMQQQVDLLEGVLISDIGFEIDEDFENASEEERERVMELFLDSIDVRRSELEKEIKDYTECQNIISENKSEIEKLNKMLPEFCPFCGSQLKGVCECL